ncbi:MAG: hypothetical protein OEY63_01620 [Gemmatimonadota bacterium]|nr:hypothetical protein [Gemmatimonadota bacterium]MDH5805950.1 hypothetical protein [Gemmatimonadota bacterium]
MSETSRLHDTVERLERQVRTLRRAIGGVVLLGITVGGLAWTFPQGQTITADRFMVLDANGIPRGSFGSVADGSIGITIADEAMSPRLELAVTPAGNPRIAMYDADQRVRNEITMNEDGEPRMVFAGSEETPRIAISLSNDGSAQILFMNPDGTTRRGMIGILSDNRPVVLLLDENGNPIFQAPSAAPAPLPMPNQ